MSFAAMRKQMSGATTSTTHSFPSLQEGTPLLNNNNSNNNAYNGDDDADVDDIEAQSGSSKGSISDFSSQHDSDEFDQVVEQSVPIILPDDVPFQVVYGSDHHSQETTPAKNGERKRHSTLSSRIDTGAVQFALRMSILLSLSALFVLVRTDSYKFPDGMWVLVSVLFVSWFPTLDAASVIEKIVQRLIGTFVGAVLGLSCGFLSIWLFPHKSNYVHQSIFLEVCLLVFTFLIIYLAGQTKVGTDKVIRKFAYATILCVLTFCICLIPFATAPDPKWESGVWRVVNVVIGCLLGAAGSIVVCPTSTTDVLYGKTASQVKMAGEAAEAVLQTASDFFAGKIEVNRLADDLLETPLDTTMRWNFLRSNTTLSSDQEASGGDVARADIALKKYEEAIADWRLSKMLFPLAKYDPFHIVKDQDEANAIQTQIARTLARTLRIQTTIVVLDGMVRNDADYDFTPQQLVLFHKTGSLIREMLTVPLILDQSNAAATFLFAQLEETRHSIHNMTTRTVSGEKSRREHLRDRGIHQFKTSLMKGSADYFESTRTAGDEEGRGIPKNVTHSTDNTLFFLQLVEHLILRSLRLYQAWKHVEPSRTT
jgi:hypothetical protein